MAMSWSSSGHVKVMLGSCWSLLLSCQCQVGVMSESCRSNVRVMSGSGHDHIGVMSGSSQGYI